MRHASKVLASRLRHLWASRRRNERTGVRLFASPAPIPFANGRLARRALASSLAAAAGRLRRVALRELRVSAVGGTLARPVSGPEPARPLVVARLRLLPDVVVAEGVERNRLSRRLDTATPARPRLAAPAPVVT